MSSSWSVNLCGYEELEVITVCMPADNTGYLYEKRFCMIVQSPMASHDLARGSESRHFLPMGIIAGRSVVFDLREPITVPGVSAIYEIPQEYHLQGSFAGDLVSPKVCFKVVFRHRTESVKELNN
jgi:hypothetical protein